MTAVLPAPVDLPGPPGSREPLQAALGQLTGAAFAAGTVKHLLEPVAVLHGWQGADAVVAGAEVAAATAVAGRLRHALACAEGLADAAERRVTFDVLVRMPTAVPRELLGRVAPLGEELADAVVDGLAVAAQAEGEYAPPDDTGVVRTEEDAARFAALSRPATDPPGPATVAAVLEQAAHRGFQRTAAVLGVPPVSEESISMLNRLDPPEREHDRRPTPGAGRGRCGPPVAVRSPAALGGSPEW